MRSVLRTGAAFFSEKAQSGFQFKRLLFPISSVPIVRSTLVSALHVPNELRSLGEGFLRLWLDSTRDCAELLKEEDQNWLPDRDFQLGKVLCSTYT